MPRIKQAERRRIFSPTPQDILASRERIQRVLRESRSHRHPFTKDDFEALARSLSKTPVDIKTASSTED